MHILIILMACFQLSFGNEHNIHLTYSKVLLEEKDITIRTSFFLDDFDKMLSNFHEISFNNLSHDGKSDSLLLPYLNQYFVVIADGDTLRAQIVSSGVEADMCFYIYSYKTTENINKIQYSNSILFKEFPDQKNMISVQHLDTNRTWSFYCILEQYTYTMNAE